MIKTANIPDSAKHMPFVAMLREGSLHDDWGLRQDAADRIQELEAALQACMEWAGSDCEHEACKGVIETAEHALRKSPTET